MFNYIVIDVVEMIVVFTKSYDVYKEASRILNKLHYENIHERIRDKLTDISLSNDVCFLYHGVLNEKNNNEYDRPALMHDAVLKCEIFWHNNGMTVRRNCLPRYINSEGHRVLDTKIFSIDFLSGYYNYRHNVYGGVSSSNRNSLVE